MDLGRFPTVLSTPLTTARFLVGSGENAVCG